MTSIIAAAVLCGVNGLFFADVFDALANLQKKSFTYTQFYKNQITYQKPLRAEPTRLICTN
jgi:hypothetical protein